MSTISGIPSVLAINPQQDIDTIRKQLQEFANAPEKFPWKAKGPGYIKHAEFWETAEERIKGWIGQGDNTQPKVLEFELIRLLSFGAAQNIFEVNDLKLIKSAAMQVGLIPNDPLSVKDHRDLSTLIGLIAKQILEKHSLPPESYLVFAYRFYRRSENQRHLKHLSKPLPLIPSLPKMDEEAKNAHRAAVEAFFSKVKEKFTFGKPKEVIKEKEEESAANDNGLESSENELASQGETTSGNEMSEDTSSQEFVQQENPPLDVPQQEPAIVSTVSSMATAFVDGLENLFATKEKTLDPQELAKDWLKQLREQEISWNQFEDSTIATCYVLLCGKIFPKSSEATFLDEWLKERIVFAKDFPEKKRIENLKEFADLDSKIGLENAAALFARLYQMSYYLTGVGSEADKTCSKEAAKFFRGCLANLIINHPQTFESLNPKTLQFEYTAENQALSTFIQGLEKAAAEAARRKMITRIALGSLAMLPLAGLAAYYYFGQAEVPPILPPPPPIPEPSILVESNILPYVAALTVFGVGYPAIMIWKQRHQGKAEGEVEGSASPRQVSFKGQIGTFGTGSEQRSSSKEQKQDLPKEDQTRASSHEEGKGGARIEEDKKGTSGQIGDKTIGSDEEIEKVVEGLSEQEPTLGTPKVERSTDKKGPSAPETIVDPTNKKDAIKELGSETSSKPPVKDKENQQEHKTEDLKSSKEGDSKQTQGKEPQKPPEEAEEAEQPLGSSQEKPSLKDSKEEKAPGFFGRLFGNFSGGAKSEDKDSKEKVAFQDDSAGKDQATNTVKSPLKEPANERQLSTMDFHEQSNPIKQSMEDGNNKSVGKEKDKKISQQLSEKTRLRDLLEGLPDFYKNNIKAQSSLSERTAVSKSLKELSELLKFVLDNNKLNPFSSDVQNVKKSEQNVAKLLETRKTFEDSLKKLSSSLKKLSSSKRAPLASEEYGKALQEYDALVEIEEQYINIFSSSPNIAKLLETEKTFESLFKKLSSSKSASLSFEEYKKQVLQIEEIEEQYIGILSFLPVIRNDLISQEKEICSNILKFLQDFPVNLWNLKIKILSNKPPETAKTVTAEVETVETTEEVETMETTEEVETVKTTEDVETKSEPSILIKADQVIKKLKEAKIKELELLIKEKSVKLNEEILNNKEEKIKELELSIKEKSDELKKCGLENEELGELRKELNDLKKEKPGKLNKEESKKKELKKKELEALIKEKSEELKKEEIRKELKKLKNKSKILKKELAEKEEPRKELKALKEALHVLNTLDETKRPLQESVKQQTMQKEKQFFRDLCHGLEVQSLPELDEIQNKLNDLLKLNETIQKLQEKIERAKSRDNFNKHAGEVLKKGFSNRLQNLEERVLEVEKNWPSIKDEISSLITNLEKIHEFFKKKLKPLSSDQKAEMQAREVLIHAFSQLKVSISNSLKASENFSLEFQHEKLTIENEKLSRELQHKKLKQFLQHFEGEIDLEAKHEEKLQEYSAVLEKLLNTPVIDTASAISLNSFQEQGKQAREICNLIEKFDFKKPINDLVKDQETIIQTFKNTLFDFQALEQTFVKSEGSINKNHFDAIKNLLKDAPPKIIEIKIHLKQEELEKAKQVKVRENRNHTKISRSDSSLDPSTFSGDPVPLPGLPGSKPNPGASPDVVRKSLDLSTLIDQEEMKRIFQLSEKLNQLQGEKSEIIKTLEQIERELVIYTKNKESDQILLKSHKAEKTKNEKEISKLESDIQKKEKEIKDFEDKKKKNNEELVKNNEAIKNLEKRIYEELGKNKQNVEEIELVMKRIGNKRKEILKVFSEKDFIENLSELVFSINSLKITHEKMIDFGKKINEWQQNYQEYLKLPRSPIKSIHKQKKADLVKNLNNFLLKFKDFISVVPKLKIKITELGIEEDDVVFVYLELLSEYKNKLLILDECKNELAIKIEKFQKISQFHQIINELQKHLSSLDPRVFTSKAFDLSIREELNRLHLNFTNAESETDRSDVSDVSESESDSETLTLMQRESFAQNKLKLQSKIQGDNEGSETEVLVQQQVEISTQNDFQAQNVSPPPPPILPPQSLSLQSVQSNKIVGMPSDLLKQIRESKQDKQDKQSFLNVPEILMGVFKLIKESSNEKEFIDKIESLLNEKSSFLKNRGEDAISKLNSKLGQIKNTISDPWGYFIKLPKLYNEKVLDDLFFRQETEALKKEVLLLEEQLEKLTSDKNKKTLENCISYVYYELLENYQQKQRNSTSQNFQKTANKIKNKFYPEYLKIVDFHVKLLHLIKDFKPKLVHLEKNAPKSINKAMLKRAQQQEQDTQSDEDNEKEWNDTTDLTVYND